MSLTATDIHVAFGGVQALDGASVHVEPGEVTGLIGPNGAGKSTLVNCLTGFVAIDRGTVWIDGIAAEGSSAHRRARRGIARTFQTPRIDPDASVADNIAMARHRLNRTRLPGSVLRTPRCRREERGDVTAVHEAAERFGLTDVLQRRGSEIPVWQLRLVEVARATLLEPRYVMLDEPAAGLGGAELELLGSSIRGLAAHGLGVLLIEHNFAFVRQHADTVTVLDRGRLLATGTPQAIAGNRAVVDSYLGATA
ncbi:ABC transporter ATP-binding protein [Aeromicrobium sp. Leaf350]|uniref:ABC transporter ATP-binding protein n=1 Tax=Aeromicrobium sp. Leaf350 TaxID=2876565 RepID=UPI001E42FCB8|nr:ATP-binding cassette domain-containing protein [Aeromicrobium sp. Leaf350]